MATELLGSLTTLQVSTDLTGASGLKTITCEESSDITIQSNVNQTKTKCGTFTAPDTPTGSINISGVVNGTPASGEVSYNELANYVNTKTKLYALYQQAASGSVGAGDAIYTSGQGYFTSVQATSAEGDLIKFTGTFTFSGSFDTLS